VVAGWVLAVDFGTCFSCGAVGRDGRVGVVEVGASRYVPSVVVVDGDGGLVTGRGAAAVCRGCGVRMGPFVAGRAA
jgi:molecular chaperone DnaK (HSP70)